MMKKIILYTGSYPFGKTTESFIGPELQVMSSYDEYEITIVPVLGDSYKRELPSNIKLDTSIVNSGITYKLQSIFGIFNKTILKELWKERSCLSSISYIFMALKYLYATNLVYYDIEKKANVNSRLTFYAFWLSYVPIAFGLYKHNHPDTPHVFISRGHRCEVYTTELGLFYPLRDFLYHNIDRVYVCSNKGMNYLQKRYPYAKNKITRAYLGVLENRSEKSDRTDVNNCFKLVSCSSVYKFKRVDLIYNSLVSYCNSHPAIKIEWTHFGGGDLFKDLRDLVANNNLSNLKVILKGAMKNEQILKSYREEHYDLFVHLSSSEGLPVSMMEAIASSIPVLATDVGGVAELVTTETGSLLSSNFSQSEFDESLTYMITNKDAIVETTKVFFDKYFNANYNYPFFYKEISSLV